MLRQPRVSVCIASYNHAQYLPAAIESVLAQTYDDFELIIVDDGSTDGSLDIAESYARRFPDRVRVHTHDNHVNRGISETVNAAYGLTQGEFWMGLPSDDLLYPEKLARQVEFLDAHPSVGWVYSYGDWIDADGQPLPQNGRFGKDVTRAAHPLHLILERNCIPGMTALMRRSCTEKVGFHEPSLIYSDWEFWVRMLAQCRVAFMAQPLIACRVHPYNTSGGISPLENMQRGRDVLRSIRRKASQIGSDLSEPRTLSLISLQLAFYSFCLGEEDEADAMLLAAFTDDSSLSHSARFFAGWLRRRVFEIYHAFPAGAPQAKFAGWVRAHLPAVAVDPLLRSAEAADFASRALTARLEDPRSALRFAIACFAKDLRWLKDPSLRLVTIEAVFGTKFVNRIRHIKSLVQGSS